MTRKSHITTTLLISVLAGVALASGQRDQFINIEGSDLKTGIENAVKRGRSMSPATPFWVAYSFDVRPGVAVDAELKEFRGATTSFSGASVSIGTSSGVSIETRNLGVFLLHEAGGSPITRIEVYNLDRKREYTGYPVYWLGRAGNEESLSFLKGLADSDQSGKVAERAILAIGLHDDRRVAGMLKEMFRKQKTDKARSAALFWLGQIGGEHEFLAAVSRNEQESIEMRKHAVFAIGVSKDAAAMSALTNLYATAAAREVKKQILFAVSINQNKDEAVDFLIKVATNDPDQEQRKQALFWLGQKAGERSLEVLGNVVESHDADTEVQRAALFAIGRRPKDEAVPRLIEIAKTHPKGEIRKQAIFWLSRSGDQRAIDFFKELLSK